ncbi:MAG TPA: DUF1648 domain-containing protein [Terriglobales bacterium]|nr:DUF1648 domain-containing protein [Terriglobales bacterium]
MKRPFQFAIALLWLTLPLVAIQYWRVWDQLRARMATHFNAAGQPNGWMSREVSVEFGIGIMAFLLVIFTPILWAISRRHVDKFAWAFLAFCAVITGVVAFGNQEVINYNLSGTPIHIGPFLLAAPAAVILSISYFGSHRGEALPSSEVLAEETHAGRAWALVFLPALLMPVVALRAIPNTAIRTSLSFVIVAVPAASAMVWSGFRYRFLKHGLEVRALGYRLRSIPRSQIVSYGVESWNPLRGYGVRGLGTSRAFVWGNKVVHIKTTNGDVYLGHGDPQRIVRDLDLVMSDSPGS